MIIFKLPVYFVFLELQNAWLVGISHHRRW